MVLWRSLAGNFVWLLRATHPSSNFIAHHVTYALSNTLANCYPNALTDACAH